MSNESAEATAGPLNEHPTSLDHAIEILSAFDKQGQERVKAMTEREFMGTSHHGVGQSLRNRWFLWWSEEGAKKYDGWPNEKPAIVKFFNDLGIYHADDMSGIILTSFYRHLTGKDRDLDEQVKHYQDFWKKQGFPDGNPMNEKEKP